jgi:hypothetical protein
VILPPQTGDEGIHTQAPDPHAGHEEEVIPRLAWHCLTTGTLAWLHTRETDRRLRGALRRPSK